MSQTYLLVNEISDELRVSNMTIYRYIKDGRLPAYKFKKEYRIRKDDFELFLRQSKSKPTVRFIELFAGIGGFRYGLESVGAKCVFASEINTECQKTYLLNFGEHPRGDITKVLEDDIPEHDILTAGFPCQPFSICGRQKGFEDTRGTLFFDILRIASKRKPRVLFLENVKHLKYHDKGRTLTTIISSLEEIGYEVSWSVLNAKDFGLAQNRERLIIIGSLGAKFDFSRIRTKSHENIVDILDENRDFEYMNKNEYTIIGSPKTQPKSGLRFIGHRNKSIRKAGVRPNTEHLSRVHKQPNRIYCSSGTHPTLPSQESSGRFFILHKNKVRKLTINECIKLMGFPKKFKPVSSNGHLYRQIGNAVAVPMIEGVGEEILNQLF